MSYPSTGGDASRASIGADMMNDRRRLAVPPEPEPVRIPEPDQRPSPHAQWDEIHGWWIEWDTPSQSWVRIDEE